VYKRQNVDSALKEDEAFSDITTVACLEKEKGVATLLLKEEGVIAGLPLIPLIVHPFDPETTVDLLVKEGAHLKPGPVARIKGSIHSLLAVERTLVNFIQHITSIASNTAKYVQAAQGKCDILDTRKTMPGYRYLQKYAVQIGGGKNHRLHLADQILIKDNHLACNTIGDAIGKARQKYPDKRVQVEVETLEMFEETLKHKPDAILLDNMSPEKISQATKKNLEGIYLEASGNIKLQNICSYADTGVNGISIGALTHSVKAIDMSLEIT
ncbi:MAG: carboxylating nicotinate-nucleotide diphosphorylase, partial [Candidatus Neptunochlamydia sp.]|nr:carboxylating nicotinate-nucleotide diphosphorylase [Candidatus Neptunochlamydia sp.]